MGLEHCRRVPYIEQMRQTECGLCCVAMILQYYKSYDGILKIRKSLDVGRDGLKLSILAEYLSERGINTKVYKAPPNTLTQFPLPAVLFWDQEHFVVLEKIEKKEFTIVDPAYGRSKLKYDEFAKHFSDIIMIAEPTVKFHPHKQKRSLWLDFFKHLKLNKKIVCGIILSSGVTYLLQLMIPMFVENIVDNAFRNTYSLLYGVYLPLVICTCLLFGACTFFRGQKMLHMQLDIDQYLTKGTFRKLLNLPYKFFESRSNGDLLFRLNCLSRIRDLISEQVIQGVIKIGMILFILLYMLNKSTILTGISILFLVTNILYVLKMRSKLMEISQYAVRANTRLQGIEVETIYSIFGIKVSGLEKQITHSWDQCYAESIKLHKKKCLLQNVNDTIEKLIQMAAPLTLLLTGIYLFQQGKVSIGEIIAVYSLSGSLFANSSSLFSIWSDFMLASSYLERVIDIMDTEEEKEPLNPISLTVTGEIQLDHVSFSYNKHSGEILKDINLVIKPGEKVAIVGTSGSGKSTLSKLLLGLYESNQGTILFDQTDLDQLNKKELRKQIGIVPQDMSLFNKTIYENISMNKNGISIEDVKIASKIAQLEDEIEAMPMKYDTLVSDMGMNLSGGQRQRVALARALVNHPKILILDEATSALDYANERNVSSILKELGCTRIVIAHRLSTIVDADKIVVLSDGEVKEHGTHNDLLKQDGIYKSLYQCQTDKSNTVAV